LGELIGVTRWETIKGAAVLPTGAGRLWRNSQKFRNCAS
jgi:hypothetical protein